MVRRYQDSDFEEVKSWGKKWEANYDKDLFPKVGFIYPGVCAYFIYQTDSKICWLENMVRNPEIPKELCDQAIEAVVTETLREVRNLGFRIAYATTANEAVIDRASKHGATVSKSQSLLQLNFK